MSESGSDDGDGPEAVDSAEGMPATSAADADPPQVKDHRGLWDEALAGLVVVSPFLILLSALALLAGLIATGSITVDVTLAGRINVMALLRPLVLPAAALLAAGYLLFAIKFFGKSPVAFVLDLLEGFERRR